MVSTLFTLVYVPVHCVAIGSCPGTVVVPFWVKVPSSNAS